MALNMRWSTCFVHDYDRDCYYFGNDPKIENAARGFLIFNDGSWKTFVQSGGKPTGAQILPDGVAWVSDDFGFEAQFSPDAKAVEIRVLSKGQRRSLVFDELGNWIFRDDLSIEEATRQVICQSSGSDAFVAVERGDGLRGRILPLKSNVFNVNGRFYLPGKVRIPDKIHYGKKDNDGSFGYTEYIYTGLTSKGLIMLSQKNGYWKYFGESYSGHPGGYGVKFSTLDDFWTFTYGKHDQTTVMAMPTLSGDQLHIGFTRYKNKTDYEVSVKKGFRFSANVICKNGQIHFKVYTPDWDSIKVDEQFENITIKYSGGNEVTVPLFKDLERNLYEQIRKQEEAKRLEEARKAEALRKAQEDARRAQEALKKAEEARKAEEAKRKAAEEALKRKEAEEAKRKAEEEAAHESPFDKEFKKLASLDKDTHLQKTKEVCEQLFEFFKSKNIISKALMIMNIEYILEAFGSCANKSQIQAIYDEYKFATGKWAGISYIEQMCNKTGENLENSMKRLAEKRAEWGPNVTPLLYAYAYQILTANNEVAKNARETILHFNNLEYEAVGRKLEQSRLSQIDKDIEEMIEIDDDRLETVSYDLEDLKMELEKVSQGDIYSALLDDIFGYFGSMADEDQKPDIYDCYEQNTSDRNIRETRRSLLYKSSEYLDLSLTNMLMGNKVDKKALKKIYYAFCMKFLTLHGKAAKKIKEAVKPFI